MSLKIYIFEWKIPLKILWLKSRAFYFVNERMSMCFNLVFACDGALYK